MFGQKFTTVMDTDWYIVFYKSEKFKAHKS